MPDGAKSLPRAQATSGDADKAVFIEENWTSHEAVRMTVFWIIGLGLGSISMLGTGLHFHMVSIFEDGGLSAEVAASAFMSVALPT